jgi:hypothetical protein
MLGDRAPLLRELRQAAHARFIHVRHGIGFAARTLRHGKYHLRHQKTTLRKIRYKFYFLLLLLENRNYY